MFESVDSRFGRKTFRDVVGEKFVMGDLGSRFLA